MSKEELIEEISDIRKKLYQLQEENIDVDEYELGFIMEYLDNACEILGELKEYLIRLLGEQQWKQYSKTWLSLKRSKQWNG